MHQLILASGSSARLTQLRLAGLDPRTIVSGVEENPLPGETALELTCRLAQLKARTVADHVEMNGPMMATHTIKDPDLAFHCGMIAHHAGAIAMAEVELQYGDDEQSKAMAQQIIDAQGPEIEEMTAWVEKNAGQQ